MFNLYQFNNALPLILLVIQINEIEVNGLGSWSKDRRLKNSRKSLDDFDYTRHHQHYHLGSYYVLKPIKNASSSIPGEDNLPTRNAQASSSSLPSAQSSLPSAQSSLPPPSSSSLVGQQFEPGLPVDDVDVSAMLSSVAKKKTDDEDDGNGGEERKISFASKVSSNIIRGPSYQSSLITSGGGGNHINSRKGVGVGGGGSGLPLKISLSFGKPNEMKSNSLGVEESKKAGKGNYSLMSSSLNVVGGNEDNTQLAHSVLVVQRPRNRPRPADYFDSLGTESPSSSSSSSPSSLVSTTTTESYPTLIYNNHRPLSKPYKLRPWYRPTNTKRKKPSTTTTTTTTETPAMTRTSTELPFPFFDDEVPILMSNNHRKFPYSSGTRNKLTSEYANYWATPSTTALYNDFSSSIFTKAPSKISPPPRRRSTTTSTTTTTTTTTTPSPPIAFSPKPPIKVSHVIANKNKAPDHVQSSVLTVLDPQTGSAHLHPNTTVIHKNVIVPYKPGRPRPAQPSTTQYPIYPILAGITTWPVSNGSSDVTISWQWDDNSSSEKLGTASPTQSTSPVTAATTSKDPVESILDSLPVSSIHRPTIAIIGSRPPGYPPFRPNFVPSSSSSSSSSTTSTSSSPASSFSSLSSSSSNLKTKPTPVTTTQHVISVTPIGPGSGHVIPPPPNISTGHHHLFGEVVHGGLSRPPISEKIHQTDTTNSHSFIITTTTTTESSKQPDDSSYVHAIYAPPMPSRPLHGISTSPVNSNTLLALFGVDSFSGLFTQLTLFKALLFTALVILLPPVTLAAAVSSLAG